MQLELSKPTFRRLVQLYLLSFLLLIAAAIYEALSPALAGFSAEFDALVIKHFGDLSDRELYIAGFICAIFLVTHLAASFALLRFKLWARWMFWASLLLLLPLELMDWFSVYWFGFWTGWISFLGSLLFGMILLLAYSTDHGAVWFAQREMKETE